MQKPFIIIDGHCDTLSKALENRRNLDCYPEAQADFIRLVQEGVKLQFFAVFVSPRIFPPASVLSSCLEQIEFFFQQKEKFPQYVYHVRFREDLEQVAASPKTGCLLAVEGGDCLEGNLFILHLLYRLGVRSLGLTWNYRNQLGDGVEESLSQGGLTRFGRQVVEEMNRLGMLIDAAHLSERGFFDVLAISSSPIIVSHANCQALWDHPRNLGDHQLQALAENGGLVGITFVPQFLGKDDCGIEQVVEHILHACTVMGPEHVGIGSDFDGTAALVPGLEGAERWGNLIQALQKRGIPDSIIRAILGENYFRILNKVLKSRKETEKLLGTSLL